MNNDTNNTLKELSIQGTVLTGCESKPEDKIRTVFVGNVYFYEKIKVIKRPDYMNIKKGDRLYIKDEHLYIDNRYGIFRYLSNDSRYRTLEFLKNNKLYVEKFEYVIDCLCETYKDDVSIVKEFLKLKKPVYNMFISNSKQCRIIL